MRSVAAFGVVLVGMMLVLGYASEAEAQRRAGPETRLGAHGLIGLGGEIDFDVEGSSLFDSEADLETTFGFGVVGEQAFHRYFLLGLRFEAAWFTTEDWNDDDIGRSTFVDLSPQAKLRFPFELGSAAAEVSFAVPFGLTLSFANDDIPGEPDTGIGFNVGALGGFAVFFDRDFGVYVEGGWRYHAVDHELDGTGVAGTDVDISTGQFVLHAGVVLGL